MFLTNVPGPCVQPALAQHGVCTFLGLRAHPVTWGTCSSPPWKPHPLYGCALEDGKIAFWHLSSQTFKAMSNYQKFDSLFKTEVAISTESNQTAL